jgi:predicted ArsR family transcriptional regulator
MKTRDGYFTEQVRDSSFRDLLKHGKALNKCCSVVFKELINGDKSIYEISVITGLKEHIVSARLSDLRAEGIVESAKQTVINPVSGRSNSLWRIKPDAVIPEQLKIF